MGVQLNNNPSAFGYCKDYDLYVAAGFPKFPSNISITKDKIVHTLDSHKGNDSIYLPKLCSCPFSHFINDERLYDTDLHNQLRYIREAIGDEGLKAWLNERRPAKSGMSTEDLDEVCQMGSLFFYEEELKISMSMSADLTIITLE